MQARGLLHEYSDEPLFEPVDVDLRPGELLTVLGPNGIGKSTLLRCLAGVITPSEGNIDRPDGFCCGYLGHKLGLRTNLTGRDNLHFSAGIFSAELTAINTLISDAGILDIIDSPVAYYSAGQKKRLALVRLVLGLTRIWFLDEPASNLDAAGQQWLVGLCQQHLHQGGCIVMAHHGPLLSPLRADHCIELQPALGRTIAA